MKTAVAIEKDEKHVGTGNIKTIRLPSQTSLGSNSMVTMDSSLFPSHDTIDSPVISPPKPIDITRDDLESSSPLLLVGNPKKYSITQTKTKDRQLANSAQRPIFQSQREYGEVYVRHKVNSPPARFFITFLLSVACRS
jgi:hypothetical protein